MESSRGPSGSFALQEVVQVAAAVGAAGGAGAGGVERRVGRAGARCRVSRTRPVQVNAVPCQAMRGRQHAVEHVHAAGRWPRGCPAASRRPSGSAGRSSGSSSARPGHHVGALLARVAHREPADGEAVERVLREEAGPTRRGARGRARPARWRRAPAPDRRARRGCGAPSGGSGPSRRGSRARSAVEGRQTSSTIITSEPIAVCISIDASGERTCIRQST